MDDKHERISPYIQRENYRKSYKAMRCLVVLVKTSYEQCSRWLVQRRVELVFLGSMTHAQETCLKHATGMVSVCYRPMIQSQRLGRMLSNILVETDPREAENTTYDLADFMPCSATNIPTSYRLFDHYIKNLTAESLCISSSASLGFESAIESRQVKPSRNLDQRSQDLVDGSNHELAISRSRLFQSLAQNLSRHVMGPSDHSLAGGGRESSHSSMANEIYSAESRRWSRLTHRPQSTPTSEAFEGCHLQLTTDIPI